MRLLTASASRFAEVKLGENESLAISQRGDQARPHPAVGRPQPEKLALPSCGNAASRAIARFSRSPYCRVSLRYIREKTVPRLSNATPATMKARAALE